MSVKYSIAFEAQSLSCYLFNKQPSVNRRLWLIALANSPGVNPLTMADSQLPTCYPSLVQTSEELHVASTIMQCFHCADPTEVSNLKGLDDSQTE